MRIKPIILSALVAICGFTLSLPSAAQEQQSAFSNGALPTANELTDKEKAILQSELYGREVLKIFSPPLSGSSAPTPFSLIPPNPERLRNTSDLLKDNDSDELLKLFEKLIAIQMQPFRYFDDDSRTDMHLDGIFLPGNTELKVESVKKSANGVFALVRQEKIQFYGSSAYLYADTYRSTYNVCEGQKYLDQPSAAHCTAFLISERYLATAAHCTILGEAMNDAADNEHIKSFKAVRNYRLDTLDVDTPLILESDIFNIKGIRARVRTLDEDWAVLELENSVGEAAILELATQVTLPDDTMVHTFGFPLGLPMKFSFGGKVTANNPSKPWFFATVDSFSGSSGSPIINDATGKVEGILASVIGNWAYKCPSGKNDCSDEDRCAYPLGCSLENGKCDTNGEQVTRIAPVLAWLNESG